MGSTTEFQYTDGGDTILETQLGIDLSNPADLAKVKTPVNETGVDDGGRKLVPTETSVAPTEPASKTVGEANPAEMPADDLSILDEKYKLPEEGKLTRSERALLKHTWRGSISESGEIIPTKVLELLSDDKAKAYADTFARSQGYKDADELTSEVEEALGVADKDGDSITNTKSLRAKEEDEYNQWKSEVFDKSEWRTKLPEFTKERNTLVKTGMSLKQAGEVALLRLENEELKKNAPDPQKLKNSRLLGSVAQSFQPQQTVTNSSLLSREQYFALEDSKRAEYAKANTRNRVVAFA